MYEETYSDKRPAPVQLLKNPQQVVEIFVEWFKDLSQNEKYLVYFGFTIMALLAVMLFLKVLLYIFYIVTLLYDNL